MDGKQRRETYEAALGEMDKLTGPSLDFEPESVESARARFPRALRDHFNPIEAIAGKVALPSKNRANVFDFIEGIRIIVSVDNLHTRKAIHVSGSFTTEGAAEIMKQAKDHPADNVPSSCTSPESWNVGELARTTIEQKFESFAPGLKLKYLMITPVGAIHFLAEEKGSQDEQS